MKFGQGYQTALSKEDYPQEWIDSAISYKKLKKCIKQVQEELQGLGLDHETLQQLWQHVGSGSKVTELNGDTDHEKERLMHYSFGPKFIPKLTVAIDPEDGSPEDAWLSPDTRRYLRRLARTSKGSLHLLPEEELSPEEDLQKPVLDDAASTNGEHVLQTVEIPLHADSEFFKILLRELQALDKLQVKEQKKIQSDIEQLGRELQVLKVSKNKQSKAQIQAWSRIFELYSDYQIFMSSHEADAGARDSAHAQRQLVNFNKELMGNLQKQPLSTEASAALDRFLKINFDLLRLLKFQEINRTALNKIMKKFDKQTALHAASRVPDSLSKVPAMSKELARSTCFTINHELLELIPQLSDYLCPVCMSISYKPVRLKCGHVFCIRCLIVMQQDKKDACPLCRAEVIMEADEANIDQQLKQFLEKNFKDETKRKQKENEYLLAVDKYGEAYGKKCVVM